MHWSRGGLGEPVRQRNPKEGVLLTRENIMSTQRKIVRDMVPPLNRMKWAEILQLMELAGLLASRQERFVLYIENPAIALGQEPLPDGQFQRFEDWIAEIGYFDYIQNAHFSRQPSNYIMQHSGNEVQYTLDGKCAHDFGRDSRVEMYMLFTLSRVENYTVETHHPRHADTLSHANELNIRNGWRQHIKSLGPAHDPEHWMHLLAAGRLAVSAGQATHNLANNLILLNTWVLSWSWILHKTDRIRIQDIANTLIESHDDLITVLMQLKAYADQTKKIKWPDSLDLSALPRARYRLLAGTTIEDIMNNANVTATPWESLLMWVPIDRPRHDNISPLLGASADEKLWDATDMWSTVSYTHLRAHETDS